MFAIYLIFYNFTHTHHDTQGTTKNIKHTQYYMIKKFISAFLFGLLLAGGEAMAADLYEAEDATTSSTEVGTSTDASGGKYIKMEAGSLTFTIQAPSAGMYDIVFHYSQTYGDTKAQNVSINGGTNSSVSFPRTADGSVATFTNTTASFKLTAGSNTLAITKSWGWVDIDYITVAKHTAASADALSATPSDPNANEAAKKLYSFLRSNYGKKTVSGVMTGDISGVTSLKAQKDVAEVYGRDGGKYPALVGFDFLFATGLNSDGSWYKSYTTTATTLATELWKEGGIPAFTWHWKDPSDSVEAFYTTQEAAGAGKPFTTYDYTKGFVSGTTNWDTTSTTYKQIVSDIDEISAYLMTLQKSGVAVLWRPLHEASGGWFWWGLRGGNAYVSLYRLVHDRMVNKNGLHNLIWVWNTELSGDVSWYPGDNYVDVVGTDIYNNANDYQNNASAFMKIQSDFGTGKLIALTENGPLPDVDACFEDGATWSYWMPWYGSWGTDYPAQTSTDEWTKIMADSRIITLGDMPGWNTYVNACDTLDTDNHIEAECADYSGTIETGTGISGTGAINMQNATDYVKATFTVPADAKYEVSVGFVNKYGKKGLTCAVNGDSLYFEDSVTHETKVGTFSFKAGKNVVSIIPTWTWSVIDYINITKASSSVANVAADERINVYPAKVTDAFTVAVDGKAQISVCDINGRQIMSQLVDGNTVIPASKLQAGIYLVKIETANNSKIFKLIK